MADHIVSLSAAREEALQKILDGVNTNPTTGQPNPVQLTKDDLIRQWVLEPIKERIRADRAASSETLQSAYEKATTQVQDQVEALLGISI